MAYRFEDFDFDPDRGLRRDGDVIALEPRATELLRYLVDNAGRIVTRAELCEQLWDGKFVSDAAISTQIRSVRKALGDDREHQRLIRTHPRRGFSFVGRVEQGPFGEQSDPARSQVTRVLAGVRESRAAMAPFRGWFLAGSIGIALLALLAILAAVAGDSWRGPGQPESDRDLSIVVLPFDNLSGDASKDYIVDAFTEDLVTDLSRIRDAFVISRSTSFTYRDQDVDAISVAAELGVRYVLEGSLRIDDERVRINAQLIDGESNEHLWANRYDRAYDELFDVQSNVTGQIASALRAELRKADSERQDPRIDDTAWDYALRGNVLLYNHQSVTDYQEALSLLSKAVSMDPDIASAWGGLAFVHFVASVAPVPGLTRPDSAQLSLEAAIKATVADPMNAEPYWLVGAGYARLGQPDRGMSACQSAIDLNPNMDCGHVCAGLVHLAKGEPTEAIAYFQRALALNPRFRPFTKEKYLGLAYIQSGRDKLAISALNRALARAPEDSFANLALTAALALDGQIDAARRTLETYAKDRSQPSIQSLRESIGWMGPEVERMLGGLRAAGLTDA